MDFELPRDLVEYLAELDAFIEREIEPLQAQDDNERFFDHRREWARTDFDNGGLPRHEWEALLAEAKRRSDKAGHLRFALPKEYGGKDGSNLWMAVIREHFAAKGLGLHNDLQNEHSIVANYPFVLIFRDFGTLAQAAEFIPGMLAAKYRVTFGLTEPDHGSDATHMETRAIPEMRDGVDDQVDTSVDERVHHLDGAMQSLQFGGRRAGDRADGIDHGGDRWPHLGFREFAVRHRRGELVQPVLLGGVKHPGGTDNRLELQADQAECGSRQAGFDQDPLRDRMLDRRTTEGQADGRASGRRVPAGSKQCEQIIVEGLGGGEYPPQFLVVVVCAVFWD